MEEYTREQIQRADDTDLYVFLSGRGEQFKRCGKEYRWLRHDSVMINKNEWYRFSQNKGGHAIDFMKALSELWVFQEKVDMKVSAFSFNSSLLIFGYL